MCDYMKQHESVETLILKYEIYTPTGRYELQTVIDSDRRQAYIFLGGN